MEEKALTVDSMSEKLESQATDVERESDSKKDLESLAGVDEKAGPKATEETEHDPNIVDWDGEEDPQNPLNWTMKKKWINGGIISFLTLITPLASALFAPSLPQVMRAFKETNSTVGSFMVSVYVLGYAFGPLLICPLSEMYGRLIVYNVTNFLFLMFTIGCALSQNSGMLIAFRLLAGIAGSCPVTIGSASITDMFRSEERGAALAASSLGPMLGPVIGPLGGAYLGAAKGWRWEFWLIAISAGTTSVAMFIFSSETYAPFLLRKKTQRLRKETANDQLKSKYENGLTHSEFLKRSIVRPVKMFWSPVVFVLSLYMAVVYGYLFLLFTTIPDVFEHKYKFHGGTIGLAYLGIGVGMISGLVIGGATSDRIVTKLTERNGGQRKPEYRLPFMLPAAMTVPIGLFMYGWSALYGVQWIVPIIGTSFVGLGMIGTFMPVITYLADAFTIYAASALAANTVLRSTLGALLPLAGPKMYDTLGLGWGNSLLGFISLAMVPFPVFFYMYGERIRTSKRFNVTF